MSASGTVVLASDNKGKLREFAAILGQIGWRMTPQGELGVPPAEEPFFTFVENALAKARHASGHTGLPALADDSGLTVDALDGAPGVYSARYAQRAGKGSGDADNNRCLIEALAGQRKRAASYVAVLVYVRHAQDPCPVIAEGFWRGQIVDEPAGANGFGYDPHFFLPEFGMTAAQLAPEVKNQHSHRAQALRALLARVRGD
jgi:XTP/dITP diphosphohydrolase